MNFSKLKLNEGLAMSGGTQTSFDAANTARENSSNSSLNRFDRKKTIATGKTRGAAQPTSPIQSGNTVMDSVDHLKQIQSEKEILRLYERQKSDWKKELQEKAVDGVEREQHPYVTVMPTGDENLIQAMKQMKGEVKDKKSELAKGEVQEESNSMKNAPSIKDAKPASKTNVKYYPGLGIAPTIKQEGVLDAALKADKKMGELHKKVDKDVERMKAGKKFKEETELSEKKNKCKDGYKWDSDKEKCVKKSSSSTTVYIGRGYGYGGHHHHDDDNDNDNGSDGGSDGGGDGGGGVGEMFDYLGDLLLQEKLNSK
jgi:hypothetical protein